MTDSAWNQNIRTKSMEELRLEERSLSSNLNLVRMEINRQLAKTGKK